MMIVLGIGEAGPLLRLVDIPNEVLGKLVYQRVGYGQGRFADIVFGLFPEGVGSEVRVDSDNECFESIARFLRAHPGLDTIDFHTHTKETVRWCGPRAAREISDVDKVLFHDRARYRLENGMRPYRHIFVTPEVVDVYGVRGDEIVNQGAFEMVGLPDDPLYKLIEEMHETFAPKARANGLPFCRSIEQIVRLGR